MSNLLKEITFSRNNERTQWGNLDCKLPKIAMTYKITVGTPYNTNAGLQKIPTCAMETHGSDRNWNIKAKMLTFLMSPQECLMSPQECLQHIM